MIASLTGRVQSLQLNRVVVEVSGVGYLVLLTPVAAAGLKIGEQIFLHTSQVVREDAITLYGFSEIDSRDFFELLQTVSGIGPRVALSMLTAFTPAEISGAISSENIKSLEKIPGIGKKVAARIILELKEKIGVREKLDNWSEQLFSALTGLGYLTKDAERAIERVRKTLGESANSQDLSDLLKLSLANTGASRE